MNTADPRVIAAVLSELIDGQAQAYAVLVGAVADVVGREALAAAFQARRASAQGAEHHPTRDRLLDTAARFLKS